MKEEKQLFMFSIKEKRKNIADYRTKIRALIKKDGLMQAGYLLDFFKSKTPNQIQFSLNEIQLDKNEVIRIIKSCIDDHIMKLKMAKISQKNQR